MVEYNNYAWRSRQRLLDAKTGSKPWWALSRELLSQRAKIQSIPALRSPDGKWVHTATGKANLIAGVLCTKNVLPAEMINDYTVLVTHPCSQKGLRPLTLEASEKVLGSLDEHSGTGPDLLPAKILKHFAKQLAYPVWMLATLILDSGEWPETWREH